MVPLMVFEGTGVGWDAIAPVISSITGTITVSNVVSIIAGVLAITITFALMWFAARYATRKINSAFKKGSARV